MYIQTKTNQIHAVLINHKLYAPIKVCNTIVYLKLHSATLKKVKIEVKKGELMSKENNLIFPVAVQRLEFLVRYINSEAIGGLDELPNKIDGIDYMDDERITALRITAKLQNHGK